MTTPALEATDPPHVLPDTPTLRQRLVAVMHDVGWIAKRGHNAFHGYKYATEADVSDAVRKALVARGVVALPDITSVQLQEVTTRKGATETCAVIQGVIWFHDAVTDERMSVSMLGAGQDGGDKAVMKGYTAAVKYGLMKAFHIPTGDDPEADVATDEAAKERAPASTPASRTLGRKAPAKVAPAEVAPDNATPLEAPEPEHTSRHLAELIGRKGAPLAKILAHYSVESLDDMTAEQRQLCCEQVTKWTPKKGDA